MSSNQFYKVRKISTWLWIICFFVFFIPSANAHKAHHNHVKADKSVATDTGGHHTALAEKKQQNFQLPVFHQQAPQILIQTIDLTAQLLCTSLEISKTEHSEYTNDNPVDLCCGHCQNVVPGLTNSCDLETKNKHVIPAHREDHYAYQHKLHVGYEIYTDSSPPTLLQGILQYRVLLI